MLTTKNRSDDLDELDPRPVRRTLPHWFDMIFLVGLWLGIPITLGVIAAIALPLIQKGRRAMDDDAPTTEPKPAAINGDRAFGYLKQIVAIGPRPAGSEANARQRKLVADHFKARGAEVREQGFRGQDPATGQAVRMVNLIGSWFPERSDRVVITAHYDTRPFPDQETDFNLRRTPFLGANDCASGVALLMEIANHLKTMPTPWGVDLVLLDGEELVYDRDGEYFLGSKAFARAYKNRRDKSKSRYVAGLVLDMVGGQNMTIKREPYSLKLAPKLVASVWGVADRLGVKEFTREIGREVLDDHLPLNDAGIPTIDIIDFDYPFWHTAGDTPEHCSAASLAAVGRVVTAWLNEPKPPPKTRRR